MTNDYLILFDDDVIDDSNDVNDEDDGGHYDGQNDVYQMHVDDVVEEISEDYLDSVGSYPVLHRTNNNNNLPSMLLSASKTLTTTSMPLTSSTTTMATSTFEIHRTVRSLNDHYVITTGHCRRSNVIGELVTDASQFLFPCTIEYSLICAAILYIMWKNISEM